MIQIEDLVSIVKITEFLHNGVDISTIDSWKGYYNPETKKIQSRISDKIPEKFVIKFDKECLELFDWPLSEYVLREGSLIVTKNAEDLTKPELDSALNMTLPILKQTMSAMKQLGLADFAGIKRKDYDEEYYRNFKELVDNWDETSVTGAEQLISKLSLKETQRSFDLLMTLSQYPEQVVKAIYNRYNTPSTSFNIKGLEAYKIIDNRLYISISPEFIEQIRDTFGDVKVVDELKYLVISRNPYDYFFCSWGSAIQSCFSLNSSCYGWYGMVPYCTTDSHFLMYLTTGKPNQTTLVRGEKINVPRMIMRCWAWLDHKGVLYLDKPYAGKDFNELFKNTGSMSSFISMLYKYVFKQKDSPDFYSCHNIKIADEEQHKVVNLEWGLSTYRDSVKYTEEGITFYKGIGYGSRSFLGTLHLKKENDGLYSSLGKITELPENFKYMKDFIISGGRILSLKRCPVTGLYIDNKEEKHRLAKYFTSPSEKTLAMTFIDGMYKIDESYPVKVSEGSIRVNTDSNSYSYIDKTNSTLWLFGETSNLYSNNINVKYFKEFMTGVAKKSVFNNVLVRYIEDDKVTYVKYKGAK